MGRCVCPVASQPRQATQAQLRLAGPSKARVSLGLSTFCQKPKEQFATSRTARSAITTRCRAEVGYLLALCNPVQLRCLSLVARQRQDPNLTRPLIACRCTFHSSSIVIFVLIYGK